MYGVMPASIAGIARWNAVYWGRKPWDIALKPSFKARFLTAKDCLKTDEATRVKKTGCLFFKCLNRLKAYA